MKIILSRKGFDSSNGGVPSPIFPDGRLLSLPIPSVGDKQPLASLRHDGIDLAQLASDLTGGRINGRTNVHLDPDLSADITQRGRGWRAAFGQSGAAQRHLINNGVDSRDLFLFYGWFRAVEAVGGRFRFVRGAPDLHVIYGWLQVAEAWRVADTRTELLSKHPALAAHPHLASRQKYSRPAHILNTVYVAADNLSLGEQRKLKGRGAGVFTACTPDRVLTKQGMTRRFWRLPKWMMPSMGRPPLSYHKSPDAWTPSADHVELRSACIGQEFVLDCEHYPEGIAWAYEMIRHEPRH